MFFQPAYRARERGGQGPPPDAAAVWSALGGWQDNLILYGSAAVALALPLLTWGMASQSRGSAGVGALLVIVGVVASARLSRYRLLISVPIGLVLGAFAAWLWWLMAIQAASGENAVAVIFGADTALAMAQRMCALVLALSFVVVRPSVIGFALVPSLTVFGLASGRLDGPVVGGLFCVFVGLSLVILAWGVLAPEETSGTLGRARPGARETDHFPAPSPRTWRSKHLLTVGAAFLICLVFGYALSLPMVAFSDLYRWPLLMAMTPAGTERFAFSGATPGEMKRFPVGLGPRALSEAPVLAVFGEPAQYWRGSVYDQYTGAAWQRWHGPLPIPTEDHTVDLSARFPAPPDAQRSSHEVRVEVDQPFLIHSPGQIQHAVLPLPEHLRWPLQIDPLGTLELPGAFLSRGDVYEVTSVPLQPEGTAQGRGLRAAEDMPKMYLTVPLSANRVEELAHQVVSRVAGGPALSSAEGTRPGDMGSPSGRAGRFPLARRRAGDGWGGKTTPEAKLEALVRYLQANYVYSLEAPAVPRGEDAADYFLFRLKRGRCDLFATALAIMARAEGIPTRLATGFLEGQYDKESGAYLLRESDRHAWVEAYVPSSGGWITLDPTPGVEAAGRRPSGWKMTWLQIRFFWQDHPWEAAALLLIVLAAALLVHLVLRSRRIAAGQAPVAARDARTAVGRCYWQFLSLLRRRGLPRRPSQTPLEYLAALKAAPAGSGPSPLPAAALSPAAAITEVFVTARYGPGPVTDVHVAAARAALQGVRTAFQSRRVASPQA